MMNLKLFLLLLVLGNVSGSSAMHQISAKKKIDASTKKKQKQQNKKSQLEQTKKLPALPVESKKSEINPGKEIKVSQQRESSDQQVKQKSPQENAEKLASDLIPENFEENKNKQREEEQDQESHAEEGVASPLEQVNQHDPNQELVQNEQPEEESIECVLNQGQHVPDVGEESEYQNIKDDQFADEEDLSEEIPDIEHFDQNQQQENKVPDAQNLSENQPEELKESMGEGFEEQKDKRVVEDSKIMEKHSKHQKREKKEKKKHFREEKEEVSVATFVENYFDPSQIDPKLDLQKDSSVVFFKKDFDLPEKAKEILEKVGYNLAIGHEEDCQLLDRSTLQILKAWIKHTLPHVVLGKEEGKVDNAVKNVELIGKLTDDLNFKDQEIIQVKATINNEKGGFNLTTWHPNENIVQESTRIVALNGVEGTCLAIHPLNQQIYVGCKDGSIKVFSAENNKCLKILRYHTAPVVALAFINNGNMLVSSAEDQVFIQMIDDYRPRVALEQVEYSKDYLYNHPPAIIRSHIGGKNSWGYGTGIDGVYQMPEGYLSGNCFEPRQIAYIYLLNKIKNKQLADPQKFKAMYNSWVKNTFEPPITHAVNLFLEQAARKYNIQCPKNSLLLEGN